MTTRARRVPFVQQMQLTDCGAACLAMVSQLFGNAVTLEEVRRHTGAGRDGTSASKLLDVAQTLGLRGRAVRLEMENLGLLPQGSILFWEFNHYVVFERQVEGGVELVDPGEGRRTVPTSRFRRSFTGVALVLEPSETFAPKGRRADPRGGRYLGMFLESPALLTRIVVGSLLLRLFALAVPLVLGAVVDRMVPREDGTLLMLVSVGLGAVLLFSAATTYLRARFLLQLRLRLDAKMTAGFLEHLVALPFSFFQARSAGDLLMRVNSNAEVREILTTNLLSGLLDGALVLVYLALMLMLHAPLAFLVLGLSVTLVVVLCLARGRLRDLSSTALEDQSRAQSNLVQLLRSVEILKASGAEHQAVRHWHHLYVDELNSTVKRDHLQIVIDGARKLLTEGTPMLVLALGAWVTIRGGLTLGQLLAFNALAVGFVTPLSDVMGSVLQLQRVGSYLDRMDDVLRASREHDGKGEQAPRLRGDVRLSHVSFAYSPDGHRVVDDVSLEISAGMSVAIVGESGSGKSTLAKLMVGLERPSQGEVFFDGLPMSQLAPASFRRQMGFVPQTAQLTGGESVRANLSLMRPEATLQSVMQAASAAQIHDAILDLPMGYETPLSDDGATLSGGQRQRLALARALLHRPAILLLDEATSALDTETERRLVETLNRLRTTRIVIAHRLSTVMACDLIVVMANGTVAEKGSHGELMRRRGPYYRLVQAQLQQASSRAEELCG